MYDQVLFTWYNARKLCGILISYVDCVLYCETDDLLRNVIGKQTKIFMIVYKQVDHLSILDMN